MTPSLIAAVGQTLRRTQQELWNLHKDPTCDSETANYIHALNDVMRTAIAETDSLAAFLENRNRAT